MKCQAKVMVAVGAAFVLIGCATSRKGRLSEELGGPDVAEREIRLRLMDYARFFSGRVDRAAQLIVDRSDETAVRQRALLWKTNAVTACHSAIFHPDPQLAVLDAWALTIQMRRYFESDGGKEAFGELGAIAIEASRDLEAEIAGFEPYLPGKSAEDRATLRDKVEQWAADHPVAAPFFTRRSVAPDLARITGDPSLSALALVESFDEKLTDAMDRLTLYVESMPEQARWQGELIMEEASARADTRASLADLNLMAVSLDHLSKLDERIEAMVVKERKTILAQVDKDLRGTLDEVDRQRTDTLRTVAEQRETVFRSLDQQREATVAVVRQERAAILAALDERQAELTRVVRAEREVILAEVGKQRKETLDRIDVLARNSIRDSTVRLGELIELFFWRLFLAGGGLILLFFLARAVAARFAA